MKKSLRKLLSFLAGLLFIGSILSLTGSEAIAQTMYEAEDALLQFGVEIGTNHTGFSGTGFVDHLNSTDCSITFTVNVADAGNHEVTVRYALKDPERTFSIYVNDVKINQSSTSQYEVDNTS